jgi:hypothetical protein
MLEASEEQPGRGYEDEAEGVDQDVASLGDEGRRTASTTPPIADDAEAGQTASPPEEDDVGVPPDGEQDRPGA